MDLARHPFCLSVRLRRECASLEGIVLGDWGDGRRRLLRRGAASRD